MYICVKFTIYFRAPGLKIVNYHGGSKSEHQRALSKIHRRGGVALTSYGMLVNNSQELAERDGRQFVWVQILNLRK